MTALPLDIIGLLGGAHATYREIARQKVARSHDAHPVLARRPKVAP